MAFKDIDWKQFFIEKGERVGLGITVLLMVVMVVVSLFLPDHGFFVPSPSQNAEKLTKVATSIEQRQRGNKPADTDKPPAVDAVPVSFKNDQINDAREFEVATRFLPPPAGSTKRRVPEQYQVDEGVAVVALVQGRSYIFDKSYNTIMVFDSGGGSAATPAPAATGPTPTNRANLEAVRGAGGLGRGAFAAPTAQPQPGGGPAPGLNPGLAPRGVAARPQAAAALSEGIGTSDRKTRYENTDKMTEADLARAAETVRPLRQTIIYATFPYKRQVEEFMRKLRLESPADVLEEASEELDKDGAPYPAFRFLRIDVQRRELRPDGQPDNWQTLDLSGAMRPLIVDNGARFEDDPPELDPVRVNGLWMPLLKQFDKENKHNRYPPAENNW